jgi:hypothetical protein
VKSGKGFENCLKYNDNDTTTYNSLLKFDFASNSVINNGEVLQLCCDSGECLSCGNNRTRDTNCIKINSLVFCKPYSTCRGIVGDFPVSANTTLGGDCMNISPLASVVNSLATLPTNNLTGLDKGYAYYVCEGKGKVGPCLSAKSPYYIFNWDNEG